MLTLYGLDLCAQNAISGYVNRDDTEAWEQEVHLTQIEPKDIPDYTKTKLVATTTMDANGFFSFERKKIADKNAIYRLHVNRIRRILNDTVPNDRLFILSNTDSIYFKQGKKLFADYSNTNKADAEWQRLQKFETKLYGIPLNADSISNAYIRNLKTYAKDSLQILLVKLIGIKQLENKKLLDRDIAKNPTYYAALLEELKASDLDRSQYLFLENKLAFLTTEAVEKKYRTSIIINMILGVIVALLLFIGLKRKPNTLGTANLSRQEKNVQGLILAGKSNKEISNELFISISTVKTHITNIYAKLNVSGRKEMLLKSKNYTRTST